VYVPVLSAQGRKIRLDGLEAPVQPLSVVPTNGHRPALQWAKVEGAP
jgi:hypothetical protein